MSPQELQGLAELQRYVLAKNFGRSKSRLWSLDNLTDDEKAQMAEEIFHSLDADLSPENLTEDGELSGPGLVLKENRLKRIWAALELWSGIKREPEDY